MAAELISRGEEGIETLKYLVKLGKIGLEVLSALDEAYFVEMTGWTPEVLDRQEPERLEALRIVWSGVKAPPKKIKKELR